MNETEKQERIQAIINSPSYCLAEEDTNLLQRDELRATRVHLELLKTELVLLDENVNSTIVALGGTQVVDAAEAAARLESAEAALANSPDDPRCRRAVARAKRYVAKAKYYDDAREFARIFSATCQTNKICDYVVVTGGGPGIMEAANRGAYDASAKSMGFNITLPKEQEPNPYITPELCFQFHYFALRKMHFLMRAKALLVFPGGFGTLDELFTALTLKQTGRMQVIPIILYGREYWERILNLQVLADEGVIADDDLDLLDYADTPEEAWKIIADFHDHD